MHCWRDGIHVTGRGFLYIWSKGLVHGMAVQVFDHHGQNCSSISSCLKRGQG